MALVNPNIAMSFRQPEFRPRNALAEYAQVQQIVGGQRQAEIADVQLENLRRKDRAISQIQAAAAKNGGPTDRREIARAYVQSGVPEFMQFGLTLEKDLDELDAFARIMGGGTRPATGGGAQPAARGTTPSFPIAGKDVPMGTLGTGTFDTAQIGNIGMVAPQQPLVSAEDRAALVAAAGPSGLTNALRQPSEGPYTGLNPAQIAAVMRANPDEQAALERALPSMKIPGVSAGQVPPFSQLSRDLLSPETRAAQDLGYGPAAQANALAPTAPPENVNQLAAAGGAAGGAAAAAAAPSADPVAALRTKRDQLIALGTPRALQAARSLDADIALMSKRITASPGSVVYDASGNVVATAPAAPITPRVEIIGVAKGTDTPVYVDKNTDAQFTIATDASGKQVRKPYTGGVNRSTSTVTATATSSPAGKSLAAEVGARANTSLVKAEGAVGIMENANMVREALNTGNVIAGPLAGVRTKFAQILELAGAGDKEKLVNTRSAIQGLASLTLESRAELKGQGQITDTETKLLERARSGSIEDMTIAELQQVVNISQRLANRMWSSHQNLLGTMEGDPAAVDTIRYYRPTMPLPQAIGESRPATPAQTDKRKQGLDAIFGR